MTNEYDPIAEYKMYHEELERAILRYPKLNLSFAPENLVEDSPLTLNIVFTPFFAPRLLTYNTRNRGRNGGREGSFGAEVLNGVPFTASPIAMGSDGVLLDGQTRLWAIINTQRCYVSTLALGLEPEAQHYYDKNRIRTIAHDLAIDGYTNTKNLTAVITMLWKLKNQLFAKTDKRMTYDEVREYAEDYYDQFKSAFGMIAKLKSSVNSPFNPAPLVVAIIKLREVCDTLADDFMQSVITGENLTRNDPTYRLRATVMNKKKQNQIVTNWYELAVIIKTWNNVLEGRTVLNLVWKEVEDFPTIFAPALEVEPELVPAGLF